MTLSDQFMTLIAFPFCFVIQLVTIDEIVSNHLVVRRGIIQKKEYPQSAPTRYLVKCGHSFIQLIPSLRYP